MTETVVLRQNYQLFNHRRNKHLHAPINIAGQVWNYCVAYQRWAYRSFGKYISKYDMMRHVAALRRDVAAYQHWQLLNSQAVKEICDRVDKAYQRFFKGIGSLPRFRKIKKQRSFALPFSERHHGRGNGNGVKLLDWGESGYGKIRITIGKTRWFFKFHMGERRLRGKLKSVSVIRTGDGKFWLSFVVEREMPRIFYPSTGKIGGFDFGLRTFLTTDEGQAIVSPGYLFEELDELKRRGKKLSGRGRKTLGSGSWKREQLAVSRLHSKIANRRSDFHWKLAHELCRRYDVLCFEDLDLAEMKQQLSHKKARRKQGDLALGEFRRKLEWVAQKAGREIRYINRYAASSKTCSVCGHVVAEMPVEQRTFECVACGLLTDRDHNAARNILEWGRDSVPGQSGDSDLQSESVSGAPVLTAEPSVKWGQSAAADYGSLPKGAPHRRGGESEIDPIAHKPAQCSPQARG